MTVIVEKDNQRRTATTSAYEVKVIYGTLDKYIECIKKQGFTIIAISH